MAFSSNSAQIGDTCRYDFVFPSKLNKPITADLHLIRTGQKKPLVLFVHGFKGFKDWGHFDLLARYFAQNGFAFAKINLSHNGLTPENLTEHTDLEAFAQNNFSIELADIKTATDFLLQGPENVPLEEIDTSCLFLIGHSRGGSVVIIDAAEDSHVKAAASWAGVSNLENRWTKQELQTWKETGVEYAINLRTGQKLPMHYQIVEDYYANQRRFNILEAAYKLKHRLLVLHGDCDEAVPVAMAAELKNANPSAELIILPGCNHVFGGQHPYTEASLPPHALQAANLSIRFFNRFLSHGS